MSYTLLSRNRTTFGRPTGKRDMVFCLVYCDDAKPYKDYDYFLNHEDPVERAKADMTVPLVLAQMRWDGKLGFVGGNVEAYHDSLIEALKDEFEEEIGVTLTPDLIARLEPLATYVNAKGTIHISSYCLKVDEATIIEWLIGANKGKHFISENCGNIVLQIHESSWNALQNQVFSGTGALELEMLVRDKGLYKITTK